MLGMGLPSVGMLSGFPYGAQVASFGGVCSYCSSGVLIIVNNKTGLQPPAHTLTWPRVPWQLFRCSSYRSPLRFQQCDRTHRLCWQSSRHCVRR
jgi:hypothetical protein